MKISEVCREGVVYIRSDESIVQAAEKMRRYHVGDLVVVDEWEPHPVPIGILTDRDIVVGLVAPNVGHLEDLTVGDVLISEDVVTAEWDDDVADVYELMRESAIRRIPVVNEAGHLVGIFTLDDAIQLLGRQLNELAQVSKRQQANELKQRP